MFWRRKRARICRAGDAQVVERYIQEEQTGECTNKMSVYMVIESRVRDAASYGRYIQLVAPIVEQFGGRYLVRGGKIVPLGQQWNPERMIILEFPTEENVWQWLSSAEYQKIAPLREQGADTRAILLEGMCDKENEAEPG